MARLYVSFLCVTVVFATPAQAQQASTPADWAVPFFGLLMNQGPDKAFTKLNEETALGQRVRTAAPLLRDAVQKAIDLHGTMMGYELAREEELGTRLVRLTYVVHHVHMASEYGLTFYRTERGWNLVSVRLEADATKLHF